MAPHRPVASQSSASAAGSDASLSSARSARPHFVLTLILVATGAAMFAVTFRGALAFNADKARTLGMRPGLAHAALLALLAVAIVASFEAIGTLLVFGLLIGPPATAGLLVRRVPRVMLVAVGLGALSVVVGLVISFHHGTAGGASIAAVAVGQFLVVLAAQEGLAAWRRARRPVVAAGSGS